MSEEHKTPGNDTGNAPAKTFTQEDVDTIVSKRLAKAMKGVPNDEELAAYRNWKSSQQTEQQRQEQREREFTQNQQALATAQAELEQLKKEKYVLGKGLTGEDAEFAMFKAEKMVDDKTTFEQAVDQIAESHKKVSFDWAAPAGGGNSGSNANDVMNRLIRGAFR